MVPQEFTINVSHEFATKTTTKMLQKYRNNTSKIPHKIVQKILQDLPLRQKISDI